MFQSDSTRFARKLTEQLRFLQRSCLIFDKGGQDEALRMAVSMRVLFWDKGRNVSLISHLHLRDGRMLSTSRGHGDYRDYLAYRLDLTSPTPVAAVPMLGTKFRTISFNDWWCHGPVFVHEGHKFSRQTIVLSATHKNGGAHVDRHLEKYYKILSTGQFAFGLTGDLKYEGAPLFEQGVTHYAENAHLALLRQFAHETLASAQHFRWIS
jgi:hypothetical protein